MERQLPGLLRCEGGTDPNDGEERSGDYLKDTLTNPCILITTYYQLVRGKKIRKEREALLNEIAKREWGLLVLDEVHVCPALSFQTVVTTVKAHCKLGLTATLVREDGKIADLDYLIGPKLYEANWMDLTNVNCWDVGVRNRRGICHR